MTVTRAILKRLHSPDALDLELFAPADPLRFSILLQALFGPENSDGEESFDIVVCTPQWLESEVKRIGIVDGRHHLVVSEFDLPQLRSFLSAYAIKCTGNTWQDVAAKLSRLGKWEFEDYKP